MLSPCFVLLRTEPAVNTVEAVRVYLSRNAAEASMKLMEWNRDAGRFEIVESKIELPESK